MRAAGGGAVGRRFAQPRDVGRVGARISRARIARHVHDDVHVGEADRCRVGRLRHATVRRCQIARRGLSQVVGADEEAVARGLAVRREDLHHQHRAAGAVPTTGTVSSVSD